MNSLSFNAKRKDYLIVLRGRRRSAWAPVQRNTIVINGRAGTYNLNSTTEMRQIDVPVLIKSNSIEELQLLKEELAAWLVTDEPKELIFDDEPDRTYHVYVSGSLDLEESRWGGMGTISFISPVAFKYGNNKEKVINDSNEPTVDGLIVNNGTADTFPKFIAEIKKLTTSLSIVSFEYHITLGSPDNVESTPIAPRERVFNESMSSTTGWTNGTAVDEGVVAGAYATDGQNFIPNGFGAGNSWHGPAAMKSLSTPVQNFLVEAVMDNDNSPVASLGRVELYLLDENSQVIGVMGVKDSWKNEKTNVVYFRAGSLNNGTYILNGYGSKKTNYNDFYGYLRVERIGNLWTVYVARIDSKGNHFVEWSKSFRDTANLYTGRLAQIQVHFGQYSTFTPTALRVRDINAYKINDLSANQIPYIGDPGDIFEIDHNFKKVRKNGELFSDIDLSSRFFALKSGNNALEVYPKEVSKVTVEYKERYL